MKHKSMRLAAFALACTILLSGCVSYHDTDKMTYVTSILLDVGEDKRPVMYFETFIPVRSASKEANEARRRTFTVKADTVSQCFHQLHLITNFYVTISHCKALLITRRAVDAGLVNYIDGFVREEDFVGRTRFVIYEGNIENYRNLVFSNERITGLYILNILEENYAYGTQTAANLLTLIGQDYSPSHMIKLPRLSIVKGQAELAPSASDESAPMTVPESAVIGNGDAGSNSPSGTQSSSNSQSQSQSGSQSQSQNSGMTDGQNTGSFSSGTASNSSDISNNPSNEIECLLNGVAFVTGTKWVCALNQKQAFYYDFFVHPPQYGIIQLPNPAQKERSADLSILRTSQNITSSYTGGRLKYNVDIRVTTRFSEAQGHIALNRKTLQALSREAETHMRQKCREIFEKYQQHNEDVFEIQDYFERVYPHETHKGVLKDTDLNIRFHVDVATTHKAFDWR